jgi:ABC-type branched-subunit amino acid transport system substrate-binding protein
VRGSRRLDSHRYIFKIPPNNDDMAAGQAREIADRGYTDVGYISPSDAYGDASLEAFTPLAERAGLKRRCRTVRARHRRRKRGDAHGVP